MARLRKNAISFSSQVAPLSALAVRQNGDQNDQGLDHVLIVAGDVHDVQTVVQHGDDQHTGNGACDLAPAAGPSPGWAGGTWSAPGIGAGSGGYHRNPPAGSAPGRGSAFYAGSYRWRWPRYRYRPEYRPRRGTSSKLLRHGQAGLEVVVAVHRPLLHAPPGAGVPVALNRFWSLLIQTMRLQPLSSRCSAAIRPPA